MVLQAVTSYTLKNLPKGINLLKATGKQKSDRLSIEQSIPAWNKKYKKPDGSVKRKFKTTVPITYKNGELNLKPALNILKTYQKNAYAGKKVLTQEKFNELIKTKKYAGKNHEEVGKLLNNAGYITKGLALIQPRGAKKEYTVMSNYFKDAGLGKQGAFTEKQMFDILKTYPGGKGFIKEYKAGTLNKKELQRKVQYVRKQQNISDEVGTISAQLTSKDIFQSQGRLRGETPKQKIFTDLIEAARQGGRLKIVKGKIPANKTQVPTTIKELRKYELVDMEASYKGGPAGTKIIKYDDLEDFMENSKGTTIRASKGLGEGSYNRAHGAYDYQDYLRNFPVTYRGDEMKLGAFLSNKKYLPDAERNAFFAKRQNRSNNDFNVEHIEEIANNPYYTRLSTKFSNNLLRGVVNRAKRVYDETSDPSKAHQTLINSFENLDLVGAERLVQFGDDYYGVSRGLKVTDLFRNIAKNLGPNTSKTLMGAAKRMEADPIFVDKFKPLLDFKNKGGRVGMNEGGTEFDALIKQNQEEHGMELKDAIDEAIKEMLERKNYADGGRVELAVGGQPLGNIGGSSLGRIGDGPTNKVGNIESMLAGIGAGLIDIPRGAFVLGSALIDMGLGTNNAAKVEKFFDELTDLDEKADATTIGGIVRLLTNLGVPGAQAWNMGTKAATKALLAKRNGNYFRITDPKLEERMKTALNGKGRLYATLGGAGAVGVSDAIFIGDVNKAGTLGDMFGGPTQLNENDENDSSKEVMNRMKFGLDSSLMMGVIGGTGSAIKTAVKRRNDLSSDNDALDRFLSKLRPRGDKPQEFFEMERANIGKRAGDVNYAGEVARSLDKHIDGIFPFVINPFNKMGNNGRKEFMKELNDVLLSGSPEIGVTGRFDFGDLDPEMVKTLTAKMKKMGAKQSDIDGVFKEFYNIRGGWGHMFSRLGAKMDKTNLDEFRTLFSKKFSNYLGSTYEIFQNKSIIPMLNYRPSEEAVNKAMVMFKQSAKEAGEEITDAQARHYVDKIVEGARLPSSPTSGLYLDVPDFFANRTILDDLGGKSKIGYENFTDDAKQVVNELLGKIEDPMQTVLAGTGRLSLIARRNEFYNDLIKRSKEEIAAGNKGFFYDDEAAAINALGSNIKKVEIDPSRTIEAGITNPMNGMYAEKSVAEAIEQSAMIQRDKEWYTQMYDSFILYPKATSQIAKTILSPITHVRNFVSAGAFAGANGLLPGVTVSPDDMAKAMKDSYRALQTNLPGSRIANDEYRELLRLGVVNSNVRLGDLQRLLKDVQFGQTLNAQTGLRGLTKQLSKVKKWTEDMYTAEDDFWKITSYALERQRLGQAYSKVGIKVDPKALNEEAASIVRNNIPNYDMVNEFVKGLRRLPFGNFVSFPAEIMRTTTNILGRALKEINYQHTLDDGRVVNPLRGIGMKRLFGLGATTVAVPYGVVEGAKTLYDVSGAEMDALRRFVPEWSRNSTLVPIKDRETGELKYIDFSHTNAYDTMIRPINTMINSVGKGIDEGEIMKNVAIGMFDATKETFSPFMSESIWFEAASDIILRGGRTREGRRLYTDETPWGEKVSIVAGHIAKTQVPGSVEAFKRLDLAVEGVDIIQKGKYDKYGRTYELGDELLGFAGARAVAVDPLRSMKFKIAEYRTGVNNARREFTTPLLRGGPVDPADIVDRYAIANQALYNVNKELFDDYYAARTLGTKSSAIDGQFADRVSTKQLNAIKTGRFKPFIPSENIIKAFDQNAREIGERNPYRIAERQINRMAQKYNNLPLYDTTFPVFENPFNLPSAPLPPAATNVTPVGGLSQGSVIQTGMNNPLINNRTMQQGQRVFGSTDPIFGS